MCHQDIQSVAVLAVRQWLADYIVFFIVTIDDPVEKERIAMLFDLAFSKTDYDPRRLIFCETEIGRFFIDFIKNFDC